MEMKLLYFVALVTILYVLCGETDGWLHRHGRWRFWPRRWAIRKPGKRDLTRSYDVKITLNPCYFDTYDINKNDEINKDEMEYIFEKYRHVNATEKFMVEELFNSLKGQNGKGKKPITRQEFRRNVSKVIKGC